MNKARNVDEIRKYCRPDPLTGAALAAFFVETDQSRDPHQETRKRLLNSLNEQADARILFYGHRGCGKSTELNKFLSEHVEEFLPVRFSVQKEMPPSNVRAEDLVLVIIERALSAAHEAQLNVSDELLTPVLEYFAETTRTKTGSSRASASVEAGVDTSTSLLGRLVGLFAKVRTAVQLDSSAEETSVALLRKRPVDLLNHANAVLEAVQVALPEGKRVLVVVEDMDKLDLKQAREIYVNHVNMLTGIRTNIIYTIPIFLFHSPDQGAFRHQFDDVISQPMIQVVEPPNERAPGFETVRQIVLARVEEGLIEPEAMDLLIEKTGGVLRHVFQVLHVAACMAGVTAPLGAEQIRYGLDKLGQELWPQISLSWDPIPGEPKSVDELYERLAVYAKQQRDGGKPPPTSDATNQLLLKSCALVEYNGKGWFGVHPLAVERLKDLGRLD